MKLFLFFGAEAMIPLEEAVIGVPIGEATWRSVPLVAEYIRVFSIHIGNGDNTSMANTFLEAVTCLRLNWNDRV